VLYGDVTDQDFWAELPLSTVRWIVLAVPFGAIRLTETDPAIGMLAAIRTHRVQGRVVLTARDERQADEFTRSGVDLIVRPFDDAALAAASQILAMDEESRRIGEPAEA
jgi:DNA-binding LytR/AlgR family response regulator